jgi:Putative peptidoglycan binding domain
MTRPTRSPHDERAAPPPPSPSADLRAVPAPPRPRRGRRRVGRAARHHRHRRVRRQPQRVSGYDTDHCGRRHVCRRPRRPEHVGGRATAGTDPSGTDPSGGDGSAGGAASVDAGSAASETGAACKLDRQSIRQGDTGPSVTCLQSALIATGYLSGSPTGTFDIKTVGAVKKLQADKTLFVDGSVGRETAIDLGIWPDEKLQVVRTPIPPPGAKDLLGYVLSSVAVSGPDAPPLPSLPANAGKGKMLVYSRINQRVWAIDDKGRVVRSWLVSGSKFNNEIPGVHKVFSKSEKSTAWNGQAILPHMVRYAKTRIGAIGFHGIPRHVSDGSRYQTDAELGTRLSGGCTRQADLDGDFVWAFADIGTTVVVL